MRRTVHRSSLIIAVACLIGFSAVGTFAQESPIALGSDDRLGDLSVTVFAADLNFPMGMLSLPDGSLLVATNVPGSSFFVSTASLVRMTDDDGDGVADTSEPLIEGLPGPVVALARYGEYVFATTAANDQGITILRRGERWRSPLTEVGKIGIGFSGAEHQSYGLAVRKSVDFENAIDVFFNVGAFGNVQTGVPATGSGLIQGTLEDASIYMVTVFTSEDGLAANEPILIARGLRNASALAFARDTGDLVIGENGIDTPENRIVSLSADEMNIIPANEISGRIDDFGFPDTYVDYATGAAVGSDGTPPAVAFPPLDGSENEGIAGIAQMPEAFPQELRDGWVAGFHGQFDSTGDANEENPVVWAHLGTGERINFASNDNPAVGHINSMTASEDALYLADVCADGELAAAEPCGVIYRVTAD